MIATEKTRMQLIFIEHIWLTDEKKKKTIRTFITKWRKAINMQMKRTRNVVGERNVPVSVCRIYGIFAAYFVIAC